MKNKISELWEKKIKNNKDLLKDINERNKKLLEEVTFTRVFKNPKFKTLTSIIGETDDLFVELHCTEHYHYFCTIEKEKVNKNINQLINICKIPLSQANYGAIKPEQKLYKTINEFINEIERFIEIINN